jgi:predicted dehydrogenase/threonine dehydrogenase-like Zn-dependent dehydrogenase
MAGIKGSGMPLWKKALHDPSKVKTVLQMAASQGIAKTRGIVNNSLKGGIPTGYSAAGTVIAVGDGIDDIEEGNNVACAGAQCSHHAEIIRVPRNLTAVIPKNLKSLEASTVTLGAIALQGIRRSKPTLGETFVVLGLGILGQLTTQLLKTSGCQVIGVDVDRTRIQLARQLGMSSGIHPNDENNVTHVSRLTGGIGADGVIITAASPSDAIISTAFKMCRKKGRVVLVGDVGLHLNRHEFYQKELDFFISTSYGPGRYDDNYEKDGLDYPIAYVRWTENRNMAAYLSLIASGKVQIKPLIAKVYPVDEAAAAYEKLKSSDHKSLMVVLSYPQPKKELLDIVRTIPNPSAKQSHSNNIRIAVIGAGSFAKSMHLPNLQSLSDHYHIQAIVSRTGHNATTTAKQFAANYATTDYQAVLNDPEVDAVLITTRHNLHAEMTLKALNAGKHVFVEKPLALNQNELNAVIAFYAKRQDEQTPMLLTGFNRRFSLHIRSIKEIVDGRSNPMIINYHMNASYIPLDHWVHNREGGGRNIGEACHLYDLFTYITNSKFTDISMRKIMPQTAYYSCHDNFVALITFEDGSVATLTYTSLGTNQHPKEHMTIYVDGKVLILNNYKRHNFVGTAQKGINIKTMDKGQKKELTSFAVAIKHNGEWPIPLWQQVQAMEIAYKIERQFLNHGSQKK